MSHKLHMIYIVDVCNMSCVYCKETKPKVNGLMNIRQFLPLAKKIYNQSVKDGEDIVRIALFGGEPLINWELIKQVLIWRDKNKTIINGLIPLEFFISTNGTLLDEEKIRFLVKHPISLSISFDGKLSNTNRPTLVVDDLYTHIINLLSFCKRNYIFNFLKLSWVVTPEALPTIKQEVIDLLNEYHLVIQEIKFLPLDHKLNDEMRRVLKELGEIKSTTFICPFDCSICQQQNCQRRNEENQCYCYDEHGNQYSGGDSYATS